MNNLPVGFPPTQSKVELKIIKELFTPEEANIAMKLSFFPQKIKQIHRKLKNEGIGLENLESILNKMWEKGIIMMGEGKGEKTYSNAMFVVGMYEYQLGRLTPNLVSNILQYFKEGYFEEFNLTGIPQLRTIPVNKAVSPEMSIASYDQLRTFIENASIIGIMDCICRKAHDLVNDPCKKTNLRETCMTFDSGARFFLQRGLARVIRKEEAYELATKFEEVGLIPSPSNSQKPFVVCNCCSCCCEVISNQKRFKDPARFFATNYYAEIDNESCIACGNCKDACPLDAIEIGEESSEVNLGKCIGCGICVINCSNDAIKLIKKEKVTVPPKNTIETYIKIIDKKNQIRKEST